LLELIDVPGHTEIHGNELADRMARVSVGKISAPKKISVHDGYRMAVGLLKKSWQRKWNEGNTGRFTYSLIPDVTTKVPLTDICMCSKKAQKVESRHDRKFVVGAIILTMLISPDMTEEISKKHCLYL